VNVEVTQVGTEAEKTKKTEAVAWENPLIPNARLRQIYLAMAQVRELERALPAARRARAVDADAKAKGTLGLEAALVSAAFDLGTNDLVSDALTGGAVDLLRGASLKDVLHPKKSAVSCGRGSKGKATNVARLIAPAKIDERIWTALGAAAALKSAQARTKVEEKAADSGVVAVYTLPDEVPSKLWKQALKFAFKQELPVVFVVLPAARAHGKKRRAAKVGMVSELSLTCGVPGIVVDADDAIAIYRVAQESIGRARAGGGAALIECIPFIIEAKGATAKRTLTVDAIAGLEQYLLQRGIATEAWIEREARSFAKRLMK
jgi:TPP-dependent pyruvate/acetoin dehydrogenase alpha subunit